MLNCERFRDKIEELGWDIAMEMDGKLTTCRQINCSECKFNVEDAKSCGSNMVKWLMSEYKEPTYEVDWTKVPIDTPVICYSESGKQFKRHFAGIDGKLPATFPFGLTSWSEDKESLSTWDRLELAEPHPEWMKCVEEES